MLKKKDFGDRYVFTFSFVALLSTFHDATYKIQHQSLQQRNHL